MLDVMRRQSTMIYVIFGAIILIFALQFGPGASGCMKIAAPMWAARVNGDVIGQQEFMATLSLRFSAMRRMAEKRDTPFDLAMAERMGIRRFVIDQLVERRLLAQEAERRGIVITDNQLLGYLHRQMGVKADNYDVYEARVQQEFGMSVVRFEEMARSNAAAEMLARVVRDQIMVDDNEAQDAFFERHDRIQAHYVQFEPDTKNVPEPQDAAINKALTDERPALQSFYDRNVLAYRLPERAHARHIVKRLSQDVGDDDIKKATEALLALRQRVLDGEDFAQLAANQSDDIKTRDNGGDLGMLAKAEMSPALAQEVFMLEPGTMVTKPLRTPEGMDLVQLIDKEPPRTRELHEVQREVAIQWLRERAGMAVAKAHADSLFKQLVAGADIIKLTVDEDDETLSLTGVKKAKKPTLRKTGWFTRTSEDVPRIGDAADVKRALFDLTLQKPLAPRVFRVGDNFYVMTLVGKEVPNPKDFSAEKEDIQSELVAQKRRRIFVDWLAQLKTQAKVDINPALVDLPLSAEPSEDDA